MPAYPPACQPIYLPACSTCSYQLAPGDGVHYDTKEAAIFKQLQATDSDGRGKEDAPSEGQRLPDSGKEASRTSEDKSSGEGGVKGGGEGGVASLEDVYGASTDEESDNDGEGGCASCSMIVFQFEVF